MNPLAMGSCFIKLRRCARWEGYIGRVFRVIPATACKTKAGNESPAGIHAHSGESDGISHRVRVQPQFTGTNDFSVAYVCLPMQTYATFILIGDL